jgi:hypothetical protein
MTTRLVADFPHGGAERRMESLHNVQHGRDIALRHVDREAGAHIEFRYASASSTPPTNWMKSKTGCGAGLLTT